MLAAGNETFGDVDAFSGMTEHREANGGLSGTGLADEPEDPARFHHEVDVVDNVVAGRCHVETQPTNRESVHTSAFARSTPATTRDRPSEMSPVPMVMKAIAAVGSTTPHGWVVMAA